jgi:hypothetical protein
VATVRMMARGPVAEKMNAASALLPYRLPKSATTLRSEGGPVSGRSIWMVGYLDRGGAKERDGRVTSAL